MSSETAIRFRDVGKCYRVGAAQGGGRFQYKSLGERLGHFARHPLRSIGGGGAVNDDEFWALRDISFDVPRGEVVGVIGRNGAGKSTLLKILSQITKPTEGEIEVHGRVGSLLEVGTGFHPELTGRENVFLNGAILGMTRREVKSKFDEIVAFSEVERFLDTPVKQYSSGMYTRLAFAVAAHLDPEILVVDEVLAVGDAEFQKKCLGKMQDVSRGGRTVLFVSHNMGAIQNLCTRGVVLSGGRCLEVTDARTAVNSYLREMQQAPTDLEDEAVLRLGSGEARLTAVEVYSDGVLTNNVACGADVELKISYRCEEPGKLAQVVATFISSLDAPTLNLNSDVTDAPMPLESTGTFVCKVPRFPVNLGRYRLAVAIQDVSGGNIDLVSNAAVVDVVSSHYFASGRYPDPKYSPVVAEHSFHHKASAEP